MARREIDILFDVDNRRQIDSAGSLANPQSVFYREQPLIRLTLVRSDLTAYTGLPADGTFSACLDNNFDSTDTLMAKTLDAGINVPGDWADADPAAGKISIRLDCKTASYKAKVGTAERLTTTKLELQGYESGETDPSNVFRFDLYAEGIMDDGGATPPPVEGDYYTAAQVDALMAAYVAKALFDANTILAATTDNTPAAVTVDEQTVLGRLTDGNIKALTTAELIGLVRPADLSLTTTATLAAVNGRRWVFCATSGNWTLTLPSAATFANCEFVIVKTGASNTLTIAPDGSETINGATGNVTLSTQWASLTLKSDGTNWICPINAQP